MSIFSIFSRSPEKQIERLRKKVKEPHGDPSVRINAAHKLYQMGTPEAILVLLDRFSITVSPNRQDDEEKEDVLAWIVSYGRPAVEPIKTFLKRERQVYWPFRALRGIVPQEELTEIAGELLEYHWTNPPASPLPLVQLIRSLQDVYSPELVRIVRRCLKDRDDDVRLAALDYLFERSEEESREAVLECFLDSEDRPRIRSYVLERLVEKAWSVKGYRPGVEETLPPEYTITRDGLIKFLGGRIP